MVCSEAEISAHSERPNAFFAVEPFQMRWNRLYKLYVTDDFVAGAWLAGQIYDRDSARAHLQQAYPLFARWINGKLERRRALEDEYDHIDRTSAEFLARDERNFRIHRGDIARLRLERRRSLGVPGNTAVLEIALNDGTQRRFATVGESTAKDISAVLRRINPWVEESGDYVPPERKPLTPKRRMRIYRRYAILFMILGIGLLGLPPVFGLPPRLQLSSAIVAVGNIVFAVVLLILARRVPRPFDADEPPRNVNVSDQEPK